MSLQIVLSYEAFPAAIALELSIAEMGLNMRANVLSSSKHLSAVLVQTRPFVGNGILLADVSQNFFWRNAGVLEASVDLEVIEQSWLLERLVGDGN